MSHRTPWSIWIGAELARTILADHKTGCESCYVQIDHTLPVDCAVDVIRRAVLGQLNLATLSMKIGLCRIEAVVVERV